MAKPINLAVLLSGSGRTLQNFIDRVAEGRLDARVSVVISSRADAYGLERARAAGIPALVVPSRKFRNFVALSDAIAAELAKFPVDLVALAGFMCFFRSRAISRARSPDSSVTTTPFTSAAGAWSHIPMHGVYSSVIFPSGVVSPKPIPSSSLNARETRSAPWYRSMMSLHTRITTWPLGSFERNA